MFISIYLIKILGICCQLNNILYTPLFLFKTIEAHFKEIIVKAVAH